MWAQGTTAIVFFASAVTPVLENPEFKENVQMVVIEDYVMEL